MVTVKQLQERGQFVMSRSIGAGSPQGVLVGGAEALGSKGRHACGGRCALQYCKRWTSMD